jgi:hypothetical protein
MNRYNTDAYRDMQNDAAASLDDDFCPMTKAEIRAAIGPDMIRSNVIGPKVSSAGFTVTHRHGRTRLSVEMSDLPASYLLGKRLFNDAADEGFVVVSTRTGDSLAFYHVRNVVEYGDLVSLVYKAVGRDDIDLVIFND